jgi:hypothetical protein
MQEIVERALLDAIPHSFRYEVYLTEKNYLLVQTTEGSHVRANVITWKICLLRAEELLYFARKWPPSVYTVCIQTHSESNRRRMPLQVAILISTPSCAPQRRYSPRFQANKAGHTPFSIRRPEQSHGSDRGNLKSGGRLWHRRRQLLASKGPILSQETVFAKSGSRCRHISA